MTSGGTPRNPVAMAASRRSLAISLGPLADADDGVRESRRRLDRAGVDRLRDIGRKFGEMTGDGGQCGGLPGEDGETVGRAHGHGDVRGLVHQLLGVGEARLHRGDEGVVVAHGPDHPRGADLIGDGVQPLEAAHCRGGIGELDGHGVGRGVDGELKVRVADGLGRGDRPARRAPSPGARIRGRWPGPPAPRSGLRRSGEPAPPLRSASPVPPDR